MYWKWIKEYGAHDFVSGLLKYGEDQSGLIVASRNANVNVRLINEFNYGDVINMIRTRQG